CLLPNAAGTRPNGLAGRDERGVRDRHRWAGPGGGGRSDARGGARGLPARGATHLGGQLRRQIGTVSSAFAPVTELRLAGSRRRPRQAVACGSPLNEDGALPCLFSNTKVRRRSRSKPSA